HIPQRDDDVSLQSLRTSRGGRNFAFGNAIRPIDQRLQRWILAHRAQSAIHGISTHSALKTAIPGFCSRVNTRVSFINIIQSASELVAELMAEGAVGFELIVPVVLRQHLCTDVVA